MLEGAPIIVKWLAFGLVIFTCILFGAANAIAATACVTVSPSSPVVGDTVTLDPSCQVTTGANTAQWSIEGPAREGGSTGWSTTVSLGQSVTFVADRVGTFWYRMQLKSGNTLLSSVEGYVTVAADANGDTTMEAQLARLQRANADSNASSSTVTIGDEGDFVGAVILALGLLVFVQFVTLIRGFAKRGH